MNDETPKPTIKTEPHTEALEPDLSASFVTTFTREVLLGNFNQRLPLSVMQSKTDVFSPAMLEHARSKRMFSPVESRRGKEDPDIQIDKSVFARAVESILSAWNKDNDPEVKFASLRKRYDHARSLGNFDSVGYVFLSDVMDGETIDGIDVLALRRKYQSRIWIDKTSKGETILKVADR